MIVGGWEAAGDNLDGRISGLRASASPSGIQVRFRHVGVSEGTDHSLLLGLNGEAIELMPSEYGTEQVAEIAAILPPGSHRIDVVPIAPEARRLPELYGAAYGRRVFLRWPMSASIDLRAYLIYANGGSGPVDFSTPVAVLEGVVLHEIFMAPGSSGGDQRASIRGAWTGAPTNETFWVEASASSFRHNIGGSWSDWQDFEQGSPIALGEGVSVVFHDPPNLYGGEQYPVRIGPPTRWLSAELAEGLWALAVMGRDAAGNISSPLADFPIAIIHRPDPVTGLTLNYDPGAPAPILLSWDLHPGPIAAIEIYSNHSQTYGTLAEDIIEDHPYDDDVGGAAAIEYAIDPAVDGVWKFRVGARDAAGRRSDSLVVVEVDTDSLPTGIRLNQPDRFEIIPGPAGSFIARWQYRRDGGEDILGFVIYEDEVVPIGVASASPGPGPVSYHEVPISATYLSPQGFFVAAVGPDGHEVPSDVVVGVPDADPPVLVEPIEGVPN